MKVVFVGSLNAESPYINTIIDNFKSLIIKLARNNTEFVIRSSNKETSRIPIDFLVVEALKEINQENQIWKLTVFKEPGAPTNLIVDIPHSSHSATTSFRNDFYKELLELVDIGVGIGGEHGLLRFSMVCEMMKKPFFLLPGADGTADFLWHEFFKKSSQMIYFDDVDITKLKQTPFINESDHGYSEKVYTLIKIIQETVEEGVYSSERKLLTSDSITLETAISSCKRFSIGLWLSILTISSIIISASIYLWQMVNSNR